MFSLFPERIFCPIQKMSLLFSHYWTAGGEKEAVDANYLRCIKNEIQGKNSGKIQ